MASQRSIKNGLRVALRLFGIFAIGLFTIVWTFLLFFFESELKAGRGHLISSHQ
jgi:hypothetical protein